MTLAELLAERPQVLLDFDEEVTETADPFDVQRAAAEAGPDAAALTRSSPRTAWPGSSAVSLPAPMRARVC